MPTPTDKKLERLDKWVQKRFSGLTGRQVDEAIQSGLILVSGRKAKKGERVLEEQIDDVLLQKHLEQLNKGNSEVSLEVVWESQDEWIIDKPAGMKSYPLSLFDTNTPANWALAREPAVRSEFLSSQPILSPHRLDTGTSGLLVVCRNKKAYENWRKLFQFHQVQKKYLAWCFGEAPSDELLIDLPIAHSVSEAEKMVVVKDQEKYRSPLMQARTQANLVKQIEGKSLWEVTCSTGVTHQVRVHLAALGLPLIGDKLYDPHFSLRNLKPAQHLLRAIELKWESHVVVAASDEYKKGPPGEG